MILEYPIDKNYVADWGIWEAVREFLQNAMDTKDMYTEYKDGAFIIENSGYLGRETLLFGKSIKSEGSRGQFGEGMKLAMLVLARMGRGMVVYNGAGEIWTPCFRESENFAGEEIFCIKVDKNSTGGDGVRVEIDVTPGEMCMIRGKWLPDAEYGILEGKRKGVIYVGGLFICTLQGFEYAYNFKPGEITLNRDRDIPSMYDVQGAAMKVLDDQQLLDLAIDQKADVNQYGYRNAGLAKAFIEAYPGTTPVGISEQHSIKADKVKVVPDWLARAIRSVGKWILRHKTSPIERLEKWRKVHGWILDDVGELDSIIADLKERYGE